MEDLFMVVICIFECQFIRISHFRSKTQNKYSINCTDLHLKMMLRCFGLKQGDTQKMFSSINTWHKTKNLMHLKRKSHHSTKNGLFSIFHVIDPSVSVFLQLHWDFSLSIHDYFHFKPNLGRR